MESINYSYKNILKLSVPLILGGFSETISSIVDSIFVGNIGNMELDSVGITNIILLLLMMIGWGIGRGVLVIFSQYIGKKNYKKIYNTLFCSIIIAVSISFVIFLFSFIASNWFLKIFISNQIILQNANNVFNIRILGIIFIYLSLIFNSYFIAIDKTKLIFYIQLSATLINILFNYFLINGILFFPKMGFLGSPTATLISEIFILLLYIIFFIKKNRVYIIRSKISELKFNFEDIKKIINIAFPIWLQHIVSIGTWVYFYSLIENMGERELAISIVLKHLFSIIALPSFCLASVSNSLVAKLVGENNIASIPNLVYKISKVSFIVSTSIVSIVLIFNYQIISTFTNDIYIIENTFDSLLMLCISLIILPYANIMFNSILGLGNSKITLIIETSTIVLYLLYIYITIVVLKCNLAVAWSSEILYWGILLVFTQGYFKFFNWQKRIRII